MKSARAIVGLLGAVLALAVVAKASKGGDFRRSLLQGEWAALQSGLTLAAVLRLMTTIGVPGKFSSGQYSGETSLECAVSPHLGRAFAGPKHTAPQLCQGL